MTKSVSNSLAQIHAFNVGNDLHSIISQPLEVEVVSTRSANHGKERPDSPCLHNLHATARFRTILTRLVQNLPSGILFRLMRLKHAVHLSLPNDLKPNTGSLTLEQRRLAVHSFVKSHLAGHAVLVSARLALKRRVVVRLNLTGIACRPYALSICALEWRSIDKRNKLHVPVTMKGISIDSMCSFNMSLSLTARMCQPWPSASHHSPSRSPGIQSSEAHQVAPA